MGQHAVLTCDIVNSTKLNRATEKVLLSTLNKLLEPYTYEFYRGDSFQVYLKPKELIESLQIALLCRTAAIKTPAEDPATPCDLRTSIGIGTISGTVKKLASAKGEAFLLSGRGLDSLSKSQAHLVISIENGQPNALRHGFELISAYTDSIFHNITTKQAEVIYQLLRGKSQTETVKTLKKSKSTISQLANTAKWSEIEWILLMYKNLINEIK